MELFSLFSPKIILSIKKDFREGNYFWMSINIFSLLFLLIIVLIIVLATVFTSLQILSPFLPSPMISFLHLHNSSNSETTSTSTPMKVGDYTTLLNAPFGNYGTGSVYIGSTDKNGNTIYITPGAYGYRACSKGDDIAIGAYAGGNCGSSTNAK